MTQTKRPSSWSDLTPNERALVQILRTGATDLMSQSDADHLLARGLAKQTLGGVGLSQLSKDLLNELAAAAKRRKDAGK